MTFKAVYGLWVAPDFSRVEAGLVEPPRVNHDEVDFGALRQALTETFKYGPRPEIVVANDTIDQVTMHLRAGVFSGRSPDMKRAQCIEFAEAMLRIKTPPANGVLDVRKAWADLHASPVRDRTFAPPPVIIPFMIKAVDFEDAMIWEANCRFPMGLRPFDIMEAHQGVDHPDGESMLPDELQARLGKIFGTPFIKPGLLARMATNKMPAYVMEGVQNLRNRGS
jgi:hypothetical protein